MTRELTDLELLKEMEEVAEDEVNRHFSVVKDWHPHDYVPWDEGRNFAHLGGKDWQPEDSALSPVAKAAIYMNLLTEDNLPSYHHTIASNFSLDGAWGTWVHRWTAEEARHSIVLRDYLVVTRGIDPVALEEARMHHMSIGFQPGMGTSMLLSVAYVTFQELATRVSHRNTARVCNDPIAESIMARLAHDENLHMLFYRNIVQGALDIAPDQAMKALYTVLTNFKMPGANLPDFRRHAVLMAKHGVYDLRQHLDDVVNPVLRKFRIFDREDFTGEAAELRDKLAVFLEELEQKAAKFEASRARALARENERISQLESV